MLKERAGPIRVGVLPIFSRPAFLVVASCNPRPNNSLNPMTIDPEGPAFGPANIDSRAVNGPQARPATLIRVGLRSGVWQVTKDGRFYGHYMADQPAFDAAEAAALAIVAGGGTADILWNDRRPQAGSSDRAKGLNVAPIGVPRTMQFRAGSTRIVP